MMGAHWPSRWGGARRHQTSKGRMAAQIIGLDPWWQTPQGQHLLAWERAQVSACVADVFGFHAVQLGAGQLDALSANRMPNRWLLRTQAEPDGLPPALAAGAHPYPHAHPQPHWAAVCDPAALPFPEDTLDLLVMPHTLEQSADPHTALREAERVLRPEGRVVITGLNPCSLWALRQQRAQGWERLGLRRLAEAAQYLPRSGDGIGYWRLRDWLRLLDFEVESVRFGCYEPAVQSARWLARWRWTNALGARWWPVLGAAYCVVAVKRVRNTRLLGPAWKPYRAAAGARVRTPVLGRQAAEPGGKPRTIDGFGPT